MVTRDGGVRYLVRLITQRQQFKSASRYEGWLRARAGTDGKASHLACETSRPHDCRVVQLAGQVASGPTGNTE
jgi:hypothetical protein